MRFTLSHSHPACRCWRRTRSVTLVRSPGFPHCSRRCSVSAAVADTRLARLLMLPRGVPPPPVQARIHEVNSALAESNLPLGAHAEEGQQLSRYPFREDPAESKVFWDVRKGLIPIVGGGREPGTPPPPPLPI